MSSSASESEIKHVLAAVDGSENAARAVKVAATVTKNNNAELTILHVLTIPLVTNPQGLPYTLEQIQEKATSEANKIIESAASIAEKVGVKPKTEIVQRVDSPVQGIIDYAENNNIDLIVVGTRGWGVLKRIVLGSVANGLVQYAHCSVLVVR